MSIIISESDKITRENLTEYLVCLGYDVASVASRQELLDTPKLRKVKVVLLDCTGNDNDDFATIQDIYALNPTVVIMVMLADPSIKRIIRFIENRVYNILVKPLSLNDFKGHLEKAIKQFQENCETRIFQENKKFILSLLEKQGVRLFQRQKDLNTTLIDV